VAVVCRTVVRRLGGCSNVSVSRPTADGNELVQPIYPKVHFPEPPVFTPFDYNKEVASHYLALQRDVTKPRDIR
jgi:hypothetical protein